MPAIEEDMSKSEHMPSNEQVDAFRAGIERWFVRFQNFYDRTNAETRNYRLAHVDLISNVYEELMTVFGDDIEGVRQMAYELNDLVDARVESVGSINPCIQEVIDARTENSERVGAAIQDCATHANVSLSLELTNVFYPAFASIQRQISTVPLAVIDALSRGNVLQDEEQIIEYLQALYEVKDMQWQGAVSQMLRWESNRWSVDGMFMVDEMTTCMARTLVDFITSTAPLEVQIRTC
jgi:hypothetical protein